MVKWVTGFTFILIPSTSSNVFEIKAGRKWKIRKAKSDLLTSNVEKIVG